MAKGCLKALSGETKSGESPCVGRFRLLYSPRWLWALVIMFHLAPVPHLRADDIFTLTDGTNVVTFSLPASPTPASNNGLSFALTNPIPLLVNGVAETTFFDTRFFLQSDGGGLFISTFFTPTLGFQADLFGPQLFTGDLTAPTFIPGTYTFWYQRPRQ